MYETGMLKDRVRILKRVANDGKFGKGSEKPTYEFVDEFWCNVTWTKGVKAMRDGALDAYDTVMFRMRWNNVVSRDSYIGYDGRIYQIMSFHADFKANTIQITAVEIVQ